MGKKSTIVPILLLVIVVAVTLELGFTAPVSIHANGRTLRSVTLRSSWEGNGNPLANLLLSQQPKHVNATIEPVFNIRENNTGIGDGTSTTLIGDGSNDAEGDGGAFSNDTQVGSRLRQNENEPCSLESSSPCSSAPTGRDKQRRIAHILTYLWTNVFGNRTRPVNKEIPRERFPAVSPNSGSFSGGIQSIAASCDLPSEVESEAWSTERYFNLYFNLTSQYPDIFSNIQSSENSSSEQQQSLESGQSHEYLPMVGSRPLISTFTISPRRAVNVVSAKLRLYKIGSTVTNAPMFTDIMPSEPCNDTESNLSSDEVVPSVFPTKVTFPEFSPSEDEKIRVSVFWYTQPATKNHYKKKLVDAKMLSLRESSWVEFDIKNAVKAWLNDRKPNFGLVVEVENENQDVLDPQKYFRSAPCFKSSSEGTYQKDDSRNEQEQDGGDITVAGGEINTSASPTSSPMIEICTLNVPETMSTNYEQTKFLPININSLHHLRRVAESHAKSNNASQNTSSNNLWQNVNLRVLSPEDFGIDMSSIDRSSSTSETQRPTTTVIVPSHRHRHHHKLNSQNSNNNVMRHHTGSSGHQQSQQERNQSRFSHPRGFTLDADHPLREILASVNSNSKESSKQRGSSIGTQQFSESLGKGLGSHLNFEMPADDSRVGGTEDFDSTEHERDVFITKIIITPAQLKESGLNEIASRREFLSSASSSSSVPPTDSTNAGSSSER